MVNTRGHIAGRIAVVAGVGLLALVVPAPANADAGPTPACGTVLISSVTLSSDLTGCTGDGLVVGADGITVDLHGHSVAGDAISHAEPDVGIRVQGHDGVTVVNGTVTGFDRGVVLSDSRGGRVEHLSSTGMTRSGIYLVGSTLTTVRFNTSSQNDVGIYLGSGSTHNTVASNHASNSEQGITIDGAAGNLVTANRVDSNGDNIIIGGDENLVTFNTVTNAVGCGPDCGGFGISHEIGGGNRIVGNLVSRTLVDGIRVSDYDPDNSASGTVVRGNVVSAAARYGISDGVEGERLTDHTAITGNVVLNSGADGIKVAGLSGWVAGNTALHSAGHGIAVVAGTRDGGGNRASGNRTSPQCVNVTCRS